MPRLTPLIVHPERKFCIEGNRVPVHGRQGQPSSADQIPSLLSLGDSFQAEIRERGEEKGIIVLLFKNLIYQATR